MAKIETIYSDPVSPWIANLMGTGVEFDKKLGYQFTGPIGDKWWQPKGTFTDPLFDEESFGDIQDYLSAPYEIGDIGQWGKENITPETLAAAYGNYQTSGDALMSSLQEGLSTGWEVDVDPIVQQALSKYYSEYVPQTVENFAGTTGISSSGFGKAMETGARQLATDIGAYEYAAQEAAAQRQGQATGMAPDIMSNYLQGQLGFGADVAGYDKYLADLERQSMPGAPLWDVFTSMIGQGAGTTVVEPAESDETANILNAVGGTLKP